MVFSSCPMLPFQLHLLLNSKHDVSRKTSISSAFVSFHWGKIGVRCMNYLFLWSDWNEIKSDLETWKFVHIIFYHAQSRKISWNLFVLHYLYPLRSKTRTDPTICILYKKNQYHEINFKRVRGWGGNIGHS